MWKSGSNISDLVFKSDQPAPDSRRYRDIRIPLQGMSQRSSETREWSALQNEGVPDMSKHILGRREFLTAASTGVAMAIPGITAYGDVTGKARTLAILGGEPVRKNRSWPAWPYRDENVVESVVNTTNSGIWCRIQSTSGTVPTFEKEFAQLMGTKFCVATGSGTQALAHLCRSPGDRAGG